MTLNKTFGEIFDAYTSGKAVIVTVESEYGTAYETVVSVGDIGSGTLPLRSSLVNNDPEPAFYVGTMNHQFYAMSRSDYPTDSLGSGSGGGVPTAT